MSQGASCRDYIYFPLLQEILDNEKIILMQCDTICGLIGKAPVTGRLLQSIKRRPHEKPFVQLFSSIEHLRSSAWVLPSLQLQKYWPGPMTCILAPKEKQQDPVSFAEIEPYQWQDSQAVRIPDHYLLQRLAAAVDAPLYSTSANRSGEMLPSKREEFLEEFAAEIDTGCIYPYLFSMDESSEREQSASTIVDSRFDPPVMIRQGKWKLNF